MIDSKLQSKSQWVIEAKSFTTKATPAWDGALTTSCPCDQLLLGLHLFDG
jgi:hypothetical protein